MAIGDISDRIASEFGKESLVAILTTQVDQKKKLVADCTADCTKLVVKGTEAQVTRHTQHSEVAQALRTKIQAFGNRGRTFVALQNEVRSMRATGHQKCSTKLRRGTATAVLTPINGTGSC